MNIICKYVNMWRFWSCAISIFVFVCKIYVNFQRGENVLLKYAIFKQSPNICKRLCLWLIDRGPDAPVNGGVTDQWVLYDHCAPGMPVERSLIAQFIYRMLYFNECIVGKFPGGALSNASCQVTHHRKVIFCYWSRLIWFHLRIVLSHAYVV